jgi:hypothetical protein
VPELVRVAYDADGLDLAADHVDREDVKEVASGVRQMRPGCPLTFTSSVVNGPTWRSALVAILARALAIRAAPDSGFRAAETLPPPSE